MPANHLDRLSYDLKLLIMLREAMAVELNVAPVSLLPGC